MTKPPAAYRHPACSSDEYHTDRLNRRLLSSLYWLYAKPRPVPREELPTGNPAVLPAESYNRPIVQSRKANQFSTVSANRQSMPGTKEHIARLYWHFLLPDTR